MKFAQKLPFRLIEAVYLFARKIVAKILYFNIVRNIKYIRMNFRQNIEKKINNNIAYLYDSKR